MCAVADRLKTVVFLNKMEEKIFTAIMKAAILLVGLTALFYWGCDKNEVGADYPLEYQLVLFNEEGEESDTFKLGEDIAFHLMLTNKGSEREISLNKPCNCPDYFSIYALPEKGNGREHIGMPCVPYLWTYEGALMLFPEQTFTIQGHWASCRSGEYYREHENFPLPQGRYECRISGKFEIAGGADAGKSIPVDLARAFKIVE